MSEISQAKFSSCRRWRYWLSREWDPSKNFVAFIGLNPSTADETVNDPTVAKCIRYAKRWDHGGLLMLNLYAFRATKPKDMWEARKNGVDIIGGRQNWAEAMMSYMQEFNVGRSIAAWGTGRQQSRGIDIALHIPGLHCLQRTMDGSPQHPLYVRDDVMAFPYHP